MIAYLFPPVGGIGSAGSQRVLKFAKYLPGYHWAPVILTVQEQYYESYFSIDPTLRDKVPSDIRIIRTKVIRWLTTVLECRHRIKHAIRFRRGIASRVAEKEPEKVKDTGDDSVRDKSWFQRFKDAITDLFEIPDEEAGWFLPGLLAGLSAITREQIDVIYSTGRPWTAHLIGTALKLLTGKPLVVDFRDPWITNPFRLKYSAFRERLETYFEKKVIEQANLVIANTDELQEEFRKRFPNQPAEKFISILNGFDPDDYYVGESKTEECPKERFTVTHAGFLYGRRDPKMFLEAVKLLVEKKAIDHTKLRVCLVGSVELPYSLHEYLSANQLDDVVCLKDHVPYKESLAYLQQSDVLLLLQPGTKTQVPSKLFEYIGMKKPILAVSPRDGSTSALVTKENLGSVAEPDRVLEIAESIEKLYRQWEKGTALDSAYEDAYQKFNVNNMTAVLARVLSQLPPR